MKKTILITILALLSVICVGQNEGPLKFLGIPVDGTETQFVAKLRGKGFVYNSMTKSYQGEFNGKDVDVYIHTNHNVVDRVYVAFPYVSEENIRIEYNNLLNQFKKNGKYIDLCMNTEISSEERISYEILVNKKRYEAAFNYFDKSRDSFEILSGILDNLDKFFTKEQIAELKSKMKVAFNAPEVSGDQIIPLLISEVQKIGFNLSGDENTDSLMAIEFVFTFLNAMKEQADGEVWFMINSSSGKYYIGLYYDNLHNKADGEDL